MASALHPSFKLAWIRDEDKRSEVVARIKEKVHELDALDENCDSSEESEGESGGNDASSVTIGKRPADAFFTYHTAKKRRSSSGRTTMINSQIDEYLLDKKPVAPNEKLDEHLPLCLRKLFRKLNTPLPSSAGAERLFSLAGRIYSPLRSSLTDKNFEMLVFLKSNWLVLNSDVVGREVVRNDRKVRTAKN